MNQELRCSANRQAIMQQQAAGGCHGRHLETMMSHHKSDRSIDA